MKKAKIITDKHYIVSEINDRLYGSFIEHLGRAVYGGIYQMDSSKSDANGFRLDTAELVKEINVPVVRYPGGNFVSEYNWEHGIGDKSKRPTNLELAWGVIEDNQFGLDEFVDWCKLVNTEPMMAINLGTKGITEAKQIVEYCNHKGGTYYSDMRIKNGHVAPHDIKLWCLGNEMDGPWQIGHKTAYEYGRIANESAKVMKWVDPSIELVACGSSSFGMNTFGAWEAEVLDLCYDNVDYISLHTYYGNHNNDYYDFLGNSVGFNQYIDAVVSVCDYVKAKRRSKKTINLSFDEWNVWYHSNNVKVEKWSKAPPQLEDGYTFEDALLVGSMLIALINHSDRIKVGCLAQLVNVIAPILTSDDDAWRQTIFYPYMHASNFGRGTAMNIIVDSPKYDSKHFTDVPYLDCAMVDNGDELTIFAVNKDLDEKMEVTCDLRQYENCDVIKHIVLNNDDIKASNVLSHKDNVTPYTSDESKLDGGIFTTVLEPHSWNVIKLKK